MMKEKDNQRRSELDELEDKALGMFTGGLLLTLDPDALSKEPVALPQVDADAVESLLDSMGVTRVTPKRAETVEAMKKEISFIFETNAEVAMLAARNFEALPDEAVKSIYEELLELQEKARRRE